MFIELKHNGLAWYIEHDDSHSTNQLNINLPNGNTHFLTESQISDYGGDGTETYVDSDTGCTFYKYTGKSGNQICAMAVDENVFKFVSDQDFNEPFLLNADKSRLNLDVALKKSEVIASLFD